MTIFRLERVRGCAVRRRCRERVQPQSARRTGEFPRVPPPRRTTQWVRPVTRKFWIWVRAPASARCLPPSDARRVVAGGYQCRSGAVCRHQRTPESPREPRSMCGRAICLSRCAQKRFDLVLFNPPFPARARRETTRGTVPGARVTGMERFAAGLGEHLKPGGSALMGVLSSFGDSRNISRCVSAAGIPILSVLAEQAVCQREVSDL